MSTWKNKTVKLKCPIEISAENPDETVKITEVVFSTPKARQIREIGELVEQSEGGQKTSDIGLLLDCLAIVSNLSPEAVDELHPADIASLGETLGPFLNDAAVLFGQQHAGGSNIAKQ